jgi:glycosyltransferase involved in cell wall biosynthesis
MRILLAQRSDYLPTRNGASKANKCMLEELARRGHECMVIAPGNDVSYRPSSHINGVETNLVFDRRRLLRQFAEQIQYFDPAVVIMSSEDLGQALLRIAVRAGKPLVYLAHSAAALPCGPEAFFHSPGGTRLLREADAIISVSEYLSAYLTKWAGRAATTLHLPVYGHGPFPSATVPPSGHVTMVNACELKGLSIFLQLADLMPTTEFAAVPGWGTTSADLDRLKVRDNITILPVFDDVDDVLRHTSLLLVPSLWAENFSLIVIEGMLRGIPVLASAVGGLPEAKLGVDYCIPVNPIASYTDVVDERLLPAPVVPPQDVGPWRNVCETLLSDVDSYQRVSQLSRKAALDYVRGISWEPVERLIVEVVRER